MKLVRFCNDFSLSYTESEPGNICLKLPIWNNLTEFFVLLKLTYTPFLLYNASFQPLTSASLFTCDNLPKIILSCSFQESVVCSLKDDLTAVFNCCKSKIILQRLSQVQFFLPEYFFVTIQQIFAFISCCKELFVLYINDHTGLFGLTYYDQSVDDLLTDTFSNINELSVGIMGKYLKQVSDTILSSICENSRCAYISGEDENCIVDHFCERQFYIKVDRIGLNFYVDEITPEFLVGSQFGFIFDYDSYSKLIISHLDNSYQQVLQQCLQIKQFNFEFFNGFSISNTFLTGGLSFQSSPFFSPFVLVGEDNFFVPIQSSGEVYEIINMFFLVDQLLSFGNFSIFFLISSIVSSTHCYFRLQNVSNFNSC